jgi:hypothetical protein
MVLVLDFDSNLLAEARDTACTPRYGVLRPFRISLCDMAHLVEKSKL